ncbi:MAG: DUF3347 domain-containing protein [Saprospiraceae bacterium]
MKKALFFIVIIIALFISACNNAAKTSHDDHAAHEATTPAAEESMSAGNSGEAQVIKASFTDVDAKASTHIDNVFAHYFHVKNALVAANTADAKSGADAIAKEIKGFDKSLLTMQQKEAYDARIATIQKAATDIAASDQLAEQRASFETLSNNIYELAKAFGGSQTLYQEYCPMAFDNKGALWLSESKEIRNPYFGDEMLTCGKVREIIE